jgi:hypothetical protein
MKLSMQSCCPRIACVHSQGPCPSLHRCASAKRMAAQRHSMTPSMSPISTALFALMNVSRSVASSTSSSGSPE